MRGEDQRNKRNVSDSNDDAPVRASVDPKKRLFYSERASNMVKTRRGEIFISAGSTEPFLQAGYLS